MTFANAQFREVGLFLGGTNYIGEVGKTTFVNPSLKSPSTTLFYKSNFSPRFTFRVELGLSSIQGIDSISAEPLRKERANSFSNSINHTSAILEVNYFEMDFSDFKTSWSPYLFAGLSYLKFETCTIQLVNPLPIIKTMSFHLRFPWGWYQNPLGYEFSIGF